MVRDRSALNITKGSLKLVAKIGAAIELELAKPGVKDITVEDGS